MGLFMPFINFYYHCDGAVAGPLDAALCVAGSILMWSRCLRGLQVVVLDLTVCEFGVFGESTHNTC